MKQKPRIGYWPDDKANQRLRQNGWKTHHGWYAWLPGERESWVLCKTWREALAAVSGWHAGRTA